MDNVSSVNNAIIDTCTKEQKEYFKFVEGFDSKKAIQEKMSNKLLMNYKFNIGDFSISFNSFNTAWMSQLKEKQSEIYFPVNCIDKDELLNTQSSLTFSIFHHPQHWLNHKNLREFKELVEASSDIILTGHEHVTSASKQYNILKADEVEYIEGGILQDSYDETVSKFNFLSIDLETKKHDIFTFEWDKEFYNRIINEDILLPTCNKVLFQLDRDYLKKISSLELKLNHPRKDDLELEDLYVFPDLKVIESNNVKRKNSFSKFSAKEFLKECDGNKSILYGKDNSGKTSLARMLQLKFREKGLIPLIVSGKNIQKTKRKNFIKTTLQKAFKEQYEQNSKSLALFEQENFNNIIILLDDFHNIKLNNDHKGSFINEIEEMGYGNIIIFADYEMELEAMSESQLSESLSNFIHHEIEDFGHMLREQLIRNWIKLGQEHEISMDELIKLRREKATAITQTVGLNFVPSFPFYILILLQAMDTNDNVLGNSSYGHYYRFLILQYLNNSSYSLKEKDINTIFGYASTLAFQMFTERKYIWDIEDLNEFDSFYKKKKGFSPRIDILKVLIDTGIFSENCGEYKFSHKYIYYYFVAYYFSQNVDKSEITEIINKMTQRLYRVEFANILMFIFHLSPKTDIINMLIREAKKIFKQFEEFSFAYDEIKKLNNSIHDDIVNKLENRSIEESREIEVKKEEKNNDLKRKINEDDQNDAYYNEEIPQLDIFKQLNLAFRLIDILGEVVKNYTGTLDAEPTHELIKNTYGMGLRGLKILIGSMEEHHELVVKEVKERIEKSEIKTKANIDEIINRFIFSLATNIVFVITKRVATAIGDQELKSIYSQIQKEDPDNTAYKMIQQAVNMRFQNGLNKKQVIDFHETLLHEKNILTYSVLKKIVVEHLYMYSVPNEKKMSICKKLNIDIDEPTNKMLENK